MCYSRYVDNNNNNESFTSQTIANDAATIVRFYKIVRFGFRLHDFDAYDNERRLRSIFLGEERSNIVLNVPSILMIPIAYLFDVETACVIYSPLLAVTGVILIYVFTKEILHHYTSSCMSAFLLSIIPSFFRNTTAGSFDGEALGVVAMICTFYLWIRSCRTKSLAIALGAVLSSFVIASSWIGGYVFAVHLIAAHVVIRSLFSPELSSIRVPGTTFLVSQLIIVCVTATSTNCAIAIVMALAMLHIPTPYIKRAFIFLFLFSILISRYVSNRYYNYLNPVRFFFFNFSTCRERDCPLHRQTDRPHTHTHTTLCVYIIGTYHNYHAIGFFL